MVAHHLDMCEAWTGDRPLTCPFAALADPFVLRVRAAYQHFKQGTLQAGCGHMSQRLAAGLAHYHRVLQACEGERYKADKALGGES